VKSLDVTVVTFNHEAIIYDCLRSVAEQKDVTLQKVVVHDDCSTDNTRDEIERFRNDYPAINLAVIVPSENVFSKNKKLPGANVFSEVVLSQSRYVAIMDGDDVIIDQKRFSHQLDALVESDAYGCFTSAIYRHTSKLERRDFFFKRWLVTKYWFTCLTSGKYIPTSSIIIDKKILKMFGDEYLQFHSQFDLDFKMVITYFGAIFVDIEALAISKNLPGSFSFEKNKRTVKVELDEVRGRLNSYRHFKGYGCVSFFGVACLVFNSIAAGVLRQCAIWLRTAR
jgi:glycosyltransferase involved in cell wall biosynthesis